MILSTMVQSILGQAPRRSLVAAAAFVRAPSLHAFCFVPMSLPLFLVSSA
jgi:hypothetical protein